MMLKEGEAMNGIENAYIEGYYLSFIKIPPPFEFI